jgi:hypothetical protein
VHDKIPETSSLRHTTHPLELVSSFTDNEERKLITHRLFIQDDIFAGVFFESLDCPLKGE